MIKRPLSKHYPLLAPLIYESKVAAKSFEYLNPKYKLGKAVKEYPFKVFQSKSVLHRKLGSTPLQYQDAKVENLKLVVPLFNQLELKNGKILSFWKTIGRPTYKRGFVDGMLLADGKVITGVGGGLCQLANMLYWLFLHTPVEVKEHHHHSYDIFPDSGRVLPFGSGAGTLFNYYDLQFLNKSGYNFKLEISMDEEFLYGHVYSDKLIPYSYKVQEKDHKFYQNKGRNFRHNKLYKQKFDKTTGNLVEETLIKENNAEVLYELSSEVFG